jgi:antitoxin CptB
MALVGARGDSFSVATGADRLNRSPYIVQQQAWQERETAKMIETETTETRRKRLRFRSWHRGTREMDLLVGNFADANLASFDDAQLDRFEALLLESDPDLYNWMIGRADPPEELDHDVMKLLRDFKYPSLKD